MKLNHCLSKLLITLSILIQSVRCIGQCSESLILFSQADVDAVPESISLCDSLSSVVLLNSSNDCITDLSIFESVKHIGYLALTNNCGDANGHLNQFKDLQKVDTFTISTPRPLVLQASKSLDTLDVLRMNGNSQEADITVIDHIRKELLIVDTAPQSTLNYTCDTNFSIVIVAPTVDTANFKNLIPYNISDLNNLTLARIKHLDLKGLEQLKNLHYLQLTDVFAEDNDWSPLSGVKDLGTLVISSAFNSDGVGSFGNSLKSITAVKELSVSDASFDSISVILPNLRTVSNKLQLFNTDLKHLRELKSMPPLAPVEESQLTDNTALLLVDNDQLMTCSYPFICDAISSQTVSVSIADNHPSCSIDSITAACLAVSVSDVDEATFTLVPYPNPATDYIMLPSTSHDPIAIYDMQGQVVASSLTPDNGMVSLQDLNPGMYVVQQGKTVWRVAVVR